MRLFYFQRGANDISVPCKLPDARKRSGRQPPVRPREPRVAAVSDFPGTAGRVPTGSPKTGAAPPCGTKIRPKPSAAGSVERGDAAEWTRPAACGGARDMELASTKRRSRTKLRGRAHPAAVTSARGAGSFRALRGRSKSSEKKPAVSRKTTGFNGNSAQR